MSATSNYTQIDRERWKSAILAKGQEVASKLEQILAGKDITLAEISLFKNDEPAETREKRLRRFLDHLMARLKVVDHPRFGWDAEAGAWKSVAELDETPWIACAP